MKKILYSIIVAIFLSMTLVACSGTSKTSEYNNQDNSDLTESEAADVAGEYIDGAGRTKLEQALAKACGASSISSLKFSSFEEGSGMIQDYCFKIKGTFNAVDEYGKTMGIKSFSWSIGVSKDGKCTIASNGIIE